MSRPEKHKGEVVGGGKVRARLKWIDGPATFMTKYRTIHQKISRSSSASLKERRRRSGAVRPPVRVALVSIEAEWDAAS